MARDWTGKRSTCQHCENWQHEPHLPGVRYQVLPGICQRDGGYADSDTGSCTRFRPHVMTTYKVFRPATGRNLLSLTTHSIMYCVGEWNLAPTYDDVVSRILAFNSYHAAVNFTPAPMRKRGLEQVWLCEGIEPISIPMLCACDLYYQDYWMHVNLFQDYPEFWDLVRKTQELLAGSKGVPLLDAPPHTIGVRAIKPIRKVAEEDVQRNLPGREVYG